MDNNLKEKSNGKGIIIVILVVLLIIACGFICYDKLIKKNEAKPKDCPVCEKCKEPEQKECPKNENILPTDDKLYKCIVDMSGKTSIKLEDACADVYDDSYNILVKNINVNGKTYELKYYVEENDPSEAQPNHLSMENSVTQVYVNNVLLDAYPGQYRNSLMSVEVKNNKLVLGEAFPSDVGPGYHTYDLSFLD